MQGTCTGVEDVEAADYPSRAITSVDDIDSEWAGTETERVHQVS